MKAIWTVLVTAGLLALAPAAHAQKFAIGFGGGNSIGSNSFVDSSYLNIWAGTYDGHGAISGWYASGNIGSSYWRNDGYYQFDEFGRPEARRVRYQSEFWVFSTGPTYTVNRYVTLFGGPGLAHRNSRRDLGSETKINFNAGVKFHIGRQSSIMLQGDSAQQGLALSVGYRVF
ncbi:MAG: hypothetical protein C0463_07785 [Idiomarina sp.]|nr:hypothetical protein [Idiomarina sp.]